MAKHLNKDPKPKPNGEWVDRDENEYDSSSDGKDELDNGYEYDDANEY